MTEIDPRTQIPIMPDLREIPHFEMMLNRPDLHTGFEYMGGGTAISALAEHMRNTSPHRYCDHDRCICHAPAHLRG